LSIFTLHWKRDHFFANFYHTRGAINSATACLSTDCLVSKNFRSFPQFDGVAIIHGLTPFFSCVLVPPDLSIVMSNISRNAIYLADEITIADARQIVEQKRNQYCTTNEIGCWLFAGSLNTDGYGQVFKKVNSTAHLTGRTCQKAILIHKLSAYAYGLWTGNPDGDNRQISHLCDVRNCFNPDHLIMESALANNERKGCPGKIGVICECCGQSRYVVICPHLPPCIRPLYTYVSESF